MDEPGFKLSEANVAIIGLGLMGGSMAMALHGRCRRLSGLDIDADVRALAQRMGVVDSVSDDPRAVLADADLVVLACPVPAILSWLEILPEFIQKTCVVLDLGSSKRTILTAMQALPLNFDPIGTHPICGKETLSLHSAENCPLRGRTFHRNPAATQHFERQTSRSTIGGCPGGAHAGGGCCAA